MQRNYSTDDGEELRGFCDTTIQHLEIGMKNLNSTKVLGLTRGLVAATAIVALPAMAATNFVVLDNPGDPNFNQLLGISDGGVIVGYFGDGSVIANNGYVLVPQNHYSTENFLDLPKGDSATETQAIGINNADLPAIVGFYTDKLTGFTHGFVDVDGMQITLDDPSGAVPKVKATNQNLLGINSSNQAAGFWIGNGGNQHGFVVTINQANPAMSKFTELKKYFPTATGTQASNITDNGDVCGFWTDTSGNNHGFYGKLGAFSSVEVVIGGTPATSTSPFGCSNTGEVVGSFTDTSGNVHGFTYSGGTYTQYDAAGSSQTSAFGVQGTFINGVNDAGSFIGFYSDGVKVHGFAQFAPVP